jgi:hypothetical protein
MKTLGLWAAAIACGAAGPAFACSPRSTTFSHYVDEADFAFYGRAEVRIEGSTGFGDEGGAIVSGTVRFSGIECYARPLGENRCPRSLTVPFQVLEDGVNCPPWISWYNPRRHRYFTLWRDEDGKWQLGGAWRSFDRPS